MNGDRKTPRPSRKPVARRAGFTLVEVQVATVLFVLVMMIMLGHGGTFYRLISWLEQERRVHGVMDTDGGRVIVAVSESGADAGPPPCEIRLLSINTGGPVPVAEVQVRQRMF